MAYINVINEWYSDMYYYNIIPVCNRPVYKYTIRLYVYKYTVKTKPGIIMYVHYYMQ